MLKPAIRFLLTILFLLPLAVRISAGQSSHIGLDPSKKFLQYMIRSWQKGGGLPQNSVVSILQSRDGYLWLATQEGLVRFDGVRFRVFSPKTAPVMLSKFVMTVVQREDGSIWAGTFGGGVSVYQEENILKTYMTTDGLPSDKITCLFEDSGHRLWVGTTRGLCYLKDSTFVSVGPVERINALGERGGTLIVGMPVGLFSYEEEKWQEYPLVVDGPARVSGIFDGGGDTLWIATTSHGVFRWTGTTSRRFAERDGLSSNVVRSVLRDRRGVIWVGTSGSGLNRIIGDRIERLETGDPLTTESIVSMIEDMEGNLWIGTSSTGLFRVSNGKFTTFNTGSGSAQNTIWTLFAEPGGELLAGTASGQIFRWVHGGFQLFYDLKSQVNVLCMIRDRSGTLWVVAGGYLRRIRNGKSDTPYPRLNGVYRVFEDSRGALWVGTISGLYVITKGTPARTPVLGGPEVGTVVSMAEDSRGFLWAGTDIGRVYRIRDHSAQEIPSRNILSGSIGPIYEDREGVVWIGTYGNGLQFFRDDTLTTITASDGLYDENVYSLLQDRQGYFWISCNNGIYRVSRQKLLEFPASRGSLVEQTFNESDGMKTSECNGGESTAIRTGDGKFWFATISGVAMVDPVNMSVNTVIPPVIIEGLTVDQKAFRPSPGIAIEAGARDLEIGYTALSFAAPENVRFRYRLLGLDDKWIEAGDRRFASFNNLPPGSYRFQVAASNNDGRWNMEGALLDLEMKPFFYQTSWFIAIIGLSLAGVVFTGFRLYGSYQEKKVKTSEMQTQLARAQLHALRMQLQPHFLFNTLNGISILIKKEPEAARGMIGQLSNLLRLTLEHQESQEVPLRKELEILNTYLAIELRRFQKRLSVHFDISPSILDVMVPTFILQPLVENSIKHGLSKVPGPSEIRISGSRDRRSLVLSVRDNGTGQTGAGKPAKEGIGLSNTRARLAQLYGTDAQLELPNGHRNGFEVVLRIPLRKTKTMKEKTNGSH